MNPEETSPEYVLSLERRVVHLESQLQHFKIQLAQQESIIATLEKKLPNTSLLSPNFFIRAFTAWGHVVFIQFIFGVLVYCLLLMAGGL